MTKEQVFGFKIKGGGEGPKHDPYHYNEYSFEFKGKKYIIHLGLAQWIEVNSKKFNANDIDGNNFYDEDVKFINYVIGDGFYDILSELIHNEYSK